MCLYRCWYISHGNHWFLYGFWYIGMEFISFCMDSGTLYMHPYIYIYIYIYCTFFERLPTTIRGSHGHPRLKKLVV